MGLGGPSHAGTMKGLSGRYWGKRRYHHNQRYHLKEGEKVSVFSFSLFLKISISICHKPIPAGEQKTSESWKSSLQVSIPP